MSTHAFPSAQRVQRRRKLLVAVAAAVAGICGFVTVWGPDLFSSSAQPRRPDLQRELDQLVTGSFRVAPGAVAYIAGPRGVWIGSSGWADVATGTPMRQDTRSRLGSVSKLWTAVVVLKLAEHKKLRLDDTVARWLPGLFPYGNRITIQELLNHTSGMIDDNDIEARPNYWLAKIHNPKLRGQLLALSAALAKNPSTTISPLFEMRVAAALPLLFTPGTQFHYSNIGYKTAAAVAEKAAGAPLDTLYHRFIIDPLKLRSAGYDATATVTGKHAVGYIVQQHGKLTDATHLDIGSVAASGGVVTNARDEATFLTSLMQDKILSHPLVAQLQANGFGTGVTTMCGQTAYTHGGATLAYMAEVAVNRSGSRVAVLLVNGRTYNSWGDNTTEQALQQLFCAA
jgi:D-alanyl-D-alanine carboxypeptidase